VTVTALACRLALAVVLALSAGGKARSAATFMAFQQSVKNLAAIPARWAVPTAAAVIAAESACAVALLIPPAEIAGESLALGLLAVFTVVIAAAVARGVRAPCHCFGTSSSPVSADQLLRNAFLIALAGLALAGTALGGGARISAGAFAVCLMAALPLAGAVAMWDDLADLLRKP